MVRRVLVCGASGRLGSAVVEAFADREVIAPARTRLDVTNAAAVRAAVRESAPDVVINCAAFNYVDRAEDEPGEALALNAYAVRNLARAAEDAGARFVHFGSDFVFDGDARVPYSEDATPAPRSTYAATKLLGDWFALDVARGFVLRVESLFGSPATLSDRRGSLDTIVDRLEQGLEVEVFIDRVVSPSYVDDVARATRYLVDGDSTPGLYHCVNSGHATWSDVAGEAARLLGVEPRLRPVTLDQVHLKAVRPRFCALDNRKLAAAGFEMPTWQDAVERWLGARGVRRDKIPGVHG
jgi:dTDP-4-dehydrorhamnose reductase